MAKALNAEKTTLVDKLDTLWKAAENLRKDILKFNEQHRFYFKGAARWNTRFITFPSDGFW